MLRFCSLFLIIMLGCGWNEKSLASFKKQVEFPVVKFQMSNGLTVLVHENHSRPLFSFQQWFRVGSSHEKPGRTGLAHFFEHLMFKGTTKYPNGEFDRIIQMNGGSFNAFTTADHTGYYANLPSDKLEMIIDMESDRMRNLVFDQTEIDREREVVKEERRMRYENSVYGSLYLQIRSTMYKTSPYRWPVIGYMSDLNATTLEELKEFYKRYYAPNNAVLVVAGDVTVSQVKKLVERYYGHIPSQEIPEFKPTPEVEQKAPRFSNLSRDVQGYTTAIVYPGVAVGHEDQYALDLMASALGSGASSRLYKRLVYKNQLATQISMSSSNSRLGGEISTYISFKPGADVGQGIALVNAELSRIKREKISESELQKLKNQIMLGYVEGLQTMSSRARSLALNEIYFDDYRRLFDDLDKYNAVTAEDIHRVANAYIVPQRRSVVQVVPKTGGGQ